MRLSQMKKKTVSELNDTAVFLANQILDVEGAKIVEKIPVPAQTLATKEDINKLTEQNTQLINLISALTTKFTEINSAVLELSNKIEGIDSKNINKQLKSLDKKCKELDRLIEEEMVLY